MRATSGRTTAAGGRSSELPLSTPPRSLGWHVISGEDLLGLLRRAAAGEDPDLLYAEAWANADHQQVDGNNG